MNFYFATYVLILLTETEELAAREGNGSFVSENEQVGGGWRNGPPSANDQR